MAGNGMTTQVSLDIQLLDTEHSANQALMQEITDLVNRVYAVAENGQWLPGSTRTTVDEVTELTKAGEIVLARLDGGVGAVVGTIRVQELDADTGEIGM